MRIFAAEAPPGLLEHRRQFGHDRYDEIWEGVLHMNAVPHGDHQELAIQLGSWLLTNWRQRGVRRVFPDRNLALPGDWPNNYRIPDIVLTTADRERFDKGSHIEGPPLVCVEIHSPNDESYEKLSFYAQLCVPEVWVIHRDTKAVDLFALNLSATSYDLQEPNESGRMISAAAGVELRGTPDFKLQIRLMGQPQSIAELPIDDD